MTPEQAKALQDAYEAHRRAWADEVGRPIEVMQSRGNSPDSD